MLLYEVSGAEKKKTKMNRIYKTVWNTLRGQLVCVNESSSGMKQSRGSRAGSTVDATPRGALVARTAVALAVAGAMGSAVAGNVDMVYDFNHDVSGGKTDHINVTVEEGYTLTNEVGIVIDGEAFGNGSYNVDKVLTNKGTIAGSTGVWTIGSAINLYR